MAYCHFELCRDCGLGCLSESLLADIRRLSVLAVVFLYQITVFFTTKHNSITFGTLFLWPNANCVRARRRQSRKRGRRWADVVFTETGGVWELTVAVNGYLCYNQWCSGAGTRRNAVPANIFEQERHSGRCCLSQPERCTGDTAAFLHISL